MAQLCFVVVRTDFDAEFNFLNFGRGVFALLFLLGQLVLELTEVGDATNRRIGGRGNLDEIETVGLGSSDGFVCFEDAELLAGGADDDTNFACANTIVNADECWVNGASVRLARDCDGRRAERRDER